MLKNKKLLLFDLDGTLIDSGPDLALALNDMLTQLHRENFSLETIHNWVGNGAQTLVKRALLGKKEIEESVEEALFSKALEIFLNSYAQNVCVETLLYPEVKTTLETLQSRGYRLAIVTNKPYDFVAPILEGLEIASYFEYFIGGDSLVQKKPRPEPLLHICEKLGESVENSLMIGDSKNDILAAHAAGMDSVGVSYGYNYAEPIELSKPTYVINSMRELVGLLE